MDDLDKKMLRILKNNGRMPYIKIGKLINLSTSAVVERVRRLEREGVIRQYLTIISGKAFEKELTALMFISLESPKYNDEFLGFVNNESDILKCHYITGNYDYYLKIVTKNPETLEHILKKIKSQVGVIKTFTNVVLNTSKNEYSINP